MATLADKLARRSDIFSDFPLDMEEDSQSLQTQEAGTSEVAVMNSTRITVASQEDMKKLFKQMLDLSKRQKKVEDQQNKILQLLEANSKEVSKSIYKVQYRQAYDAHAKEMEFDAFINSCEKWQITLFRHWRAEELRKLGGQGMWRDLAKKHTDIVAEKDLPGMKVPSTLQEDLHLHLKREIALERQYLKEEKEKDRQRWKFWEGYYSWRVENGFIEMDAERWEGILQVDNLEYPAEE